MSARRTDQADEPIDLTSALSKAYLSGNGAEVERIMALMVAAEQAAVEQKVSRRGRAA